MSERVKIKDGIEIEIRDGSAVLFLLDQGAIAAFNAAEARALAEALEPILRPLFKKFLLAARREAACDVLRGAEQIVRKALVGTAQEPLRSVIEESIVVSLRHFADDLRGES